MIFIGLTVQLVATWGLAFSNIKCFVAVIVVPAVGHGDSVSRWLLTLTVAGIETSPQFKHILAISLME